MDLTKLTVILLLLAASTCRGKLVIEDTTKYEKSMARLGDVLVNLVTSCHKGRTSGVGLAGNLPSTLYKRLSAEHLIPVALMRIVNEWEYRVMSGKFKHSLNTFIIGPANLDELYKSFLSNMRHLRWWNYMASFYIVDLSSGCVNLAEFLYAAWRCDLLHSTVLCRSHTSGRIAFTYNPFTGNGPVSWRKELELYYDHHIFTVISRDKFRDNETIVCEDFFYDKTSDLNGYDLRIKGQHDDYSKSTATTLRRGTYAFETRRRSMLRTLFSNLKATVTFVDGSKSVHYGMHAEPQGLQYKLAHHFVLTYPHGQVEASIITQFRGHKTQLTKILSVIDEASWYGTGVVYLITLIFLKIFVRQTVAPTLLNLVRMTCNVAFENLPNDTSSRIYIGCLLFFVVTMQGIFQGNLAARLTKYMPLKNVESIRDLEELGYKICGREYYRRAFEDSAVHKNFIASDDERDCIMRVIKDSSSAYVGRVESFIIDLVEEFNLHISRKPVEMIYVGFPIYPDWTLTDRVNAMISRLVEADGLELWEIKCRPVQLSDFYEDPAVKSNVDFKNIELHELTFAFIILGIGLTCATVVLIIEIAIEYKYVCEITISRRGDTWEERVVEVFPDNPCTQ